VSTVLIKICGVTTPEDAAMVAAAGADAIGVNLWPGSKRHVTFARYAPAFRSLIAVSSLPLPPQATPFYRHGTSALDDPSRA